MVAARATREGLDRAIFDGEEFDGGTLPIVETCWKLLARGLPWPLAFKEDLEVGLAEEVVEERTAALSEDNIA